jgi:ligand-binding sensor domain-containing protein
MPGLQTKRGNSRLFGRWMQPLLLFAFLPPGGLTARTHAWTATSGSSAPAKAAPAEQYTRHIWRIQDGLPEDTVQSIEQSGDGYLWIGTTGGLVRFDGSHFHLYDHATTPALADNSVFCTLAARDGSLWIGTDGGGLVHFKDGIFRAYAEATGLTNSFVRSLMEDDQGRIWIGTDNGLFQMI